jgi:hypothetical protein
MFNKKNKDRRIECILKPFVSSLSNSRSAFELNVDWMILITFVYEVTLIKTIKDRQNKMYTEVQTR